MIVSSATNPPHSLDTLPDDCKDCIVDALGVADRARLAGASQAWRERIAGSWERLYQHESDLQHRLGPCSGLQLMREKVAAENELFGAGARARGLIDADTAYAQALYFAQQEGHHVAVIVGMQHARGQQRWSAEGAHALGIALQESGQVAAAAACLSTSLAQHPAAADRALLLAIATQDHVLLDAALQNGKASADGLQRGVFEAVRLGLSAALEKLLQAGAGVAHVQGRWSAVTLAAYRRDRACLQLLLRHPTAIYQSNAQGMQPLHLVLTTDQLPMPSDISGDVPSRGTEITAIVRDLLARGAAVNEPGGTPEVTPLELAIQGHFADVPALLLERGAHRDVCMGQARIPALGYALICHNVDAAQALADAQARIDAPAPQAKTLLHWMVQHNHASAAAWLLRHGAAGTVETADGNTLVHLAVHLPGTKMLKVLVHGGLPTSAPNAAGERPLSLAVRLDKVEHARALLDLGAPLNATEVGGRSVLQRAAELGRVAMVDLFLQYHADLDATDRDGNTALILAATQAGRYGLRSEPLRRLLGKGRLKAPADPFVAIVTALQRAAANRALRNKRGMCAADMLPAASVLGRTLRAH